MARRVKKTKKSVLHLIELAGKPVFFLFTFSVVLILSYLHLLKVFTRTLFHTLKSLHLPKITFPNLKKPSYPKRKWFTVPRFRLPRLPEFHTVTFPRISRPSFPKFRRAEDKHKHTPSRRISLLGKVALFVSAMIICVSAGSYGLYMRLLKDLPSPLLLQEKIPSLSTKIYDRNGVLLYQIYRDENRSLVKLDELPSYLIEATVASEDKNFYSHRGISLRGIARAVVANLDGFYTCFTEGTVKNLRKCALSLQGGSTITQQLVKNALLSPEQTLARKIREAYLALWTERLYTKQKILEMYFNYVPYGGTAYGIEEASQQYYGKPAADVTLPEAALLAGLPVSPTTLSPFGTRPYLAKNRQSQVLDAMVEMGYLSDEDALTAKSASITFRPKEKNIRAPHFVMYVKDLLVKELGEDLVNQGGLEVHTTLDLDKQHILEKEIKTELARLKSLKVGNAAGMIVIPPTGEILAMAGSHDFFDTAGDGQVNVTLQPRQPGSSIKPITYTLGFMNGLTPNTRIEDAPVCFVIPGSPNYCPDNYDGRFHGTVSARTALASSYNIPAIKLLNSLGVHNLVKLGQEMGITTWNDSSRFGLSLTLGGGEVTMYDMAQVYSVFANGGRKVPLQAISSVRDHSGRNISLTPQVPAHVAQAEEVETPKQVIPEVVAYQINSILADPAARAPAFGTRSVLNIPKYQVAVKTGTTNNLRDNWTFGYTPDILVATWVGNNDNSPMSSVASGITGASPIWSKTMSTLLEGTERHDFLRPAKMLAVPICPSTSAYYCRNLCPTPPRTEYFVPGTEPKKDCSEQSGKITDSAASTTHP